MRITLWLFLFTFLLSSCNPLPEDDKDKTVFRYNESSGITSLDPAFSKDLANIWPCNLLYNTLVELNEHLEAVPSLANDWEVSPDGRIYTFHLKKDVSFHDNPLFKDGKGRQVSAGDFVYSFNRILDPAVASPGSWVFSKVDKKNGEYCFNALNDSTLEIVLSDPFPPFLGILGMKYCSVVPHEIVDHYGKDFRKNPVGTGPFQLKVWKEGVKMVLTKNEHYFEYFNGRQLPYLDAVAITFQIDKQSAFLEFVKGNIDFLSGIDPAYKDEVLTYDGHLRQKYTDRFYLLTEPYLNTEYIGILVDTSLEGVKGSPLGKIEVRKALNYAFDREKMVKHLRNNMVTPGKWGILPPGLRSFDSSRFYYTYHPDSARLLLEKAGYPNGVGMPEIKLFTTADYVDLFKYLQYQYEALGIAMSIEVTPYATLKELKAQSKIDFFRASWIADYPDGENYLSLFCSWNFTPSGPNYTHYSNPEYDSLYKLSQSTTSDSLRIEYYRKMNDLVMQDAPVIILYYDQVIRLVSDKVTGLGINPLNMLNLKFVKKNENEENRPL